MHRSSFNGCGNNSKLSSVEFQRWQAKTQKKSEELWSNWNSKIEIFR